MPGPERQVRVRVAREVQRRPARSNAAGSRFADPNSSATSSPRGISTPVDLDRLEDPALEQRERRVEAQQLLDGGRQEVRLGAQPGQRVGMAEERPPAVAGAVDRRLVTGVEEQHAGRDQLRLGQRVAVVDDRGQGADQVVARPCAAARRAARAGRPRTRRSPGPPCAPTSSGGLSSYIRQMSADHGRR